MAMECSSPFLDNHLLAMAERGDVKEVEQAIKAGANVNFLNEWGLSPLHIAVQRGYLNCMMVLLNNGADPNGKGRLTELHHMTGVSRNLKGLEWAPLHTSVMYDQPETIEILIKYGADVNFRDMNGRSALDASKIHNNPRCTKVLLAYEANEAFMGCEKPIVLDNAAMEKSVSTYMIHQLGQVENSMPLHSAVAKDKHKELKTLLRLGLDINMRNSSGETALHIAVQRNNLECGKLLLNKGADPDVKFEDDLTALHLSVRKANIEFVKLLIKNGASVNVGTKTGRMSLHIATHSNNTHIMKVLLENGANVNAKDTKLKLTPLNLAIYHTNIECINMLVEHGADVFEENSFGETVLEDAAKRGVSFFKMVMCKKDIKRKGKKGLTPLHIAAAYDLESVEMLLDKGAKVNAKLSSGLTPLHVAVQKGKLQNAELLIKWKANINAKNNIGLTPLHVSAREGTADCLRMLVQHGASVNEVDNVQATPLHLAAFAGHVECVAILIEFGSDINASNQENDTVLMLAARNASFECVKLLLDHNASLWSSKQLKYVE